MKFDWNKILLYVLGLLGTLLGGTAVYTDFAAGEVIERPAPVPALGYEYLAVVQLQAKTPSGALPSVNYGRELSFVITSRSAKPGTGEVSKAAAKIIEKLPDSPVIKSYDLYLLGRKPVKESAEESPEKGIDES